MKVIRGNNKPKSKLQVFLHWVKTTEPDNYPLVALALMGIMLGIYIVYTLIIFVIVGILALIW